MTTHPIADTRGGAWTRWQGVVLALALALALPRCEEELPPPDPTAPLRLELGQGTCFTPTAEGEPLLVQRGGQGSQHVFVALRAWNLSPLSAMVDLALTQVDTGQQLTPPYRVRLPFSAGSGLDAPAELTGVQLIIPNPQLVAGQTVRLTASVESASGQQATDSRTGPLQWGTNPCQ